LPEWEPIVLGEEPQKNKPMVPRLIPHDRRLCPNDRWESLPVQRGICLLHSPFFLFQQTAMIFLSFIPLEIARDKQEETLFQNR
jgi:hypothetical protein